MDTNNTYNDCLISSTPDCRVRFSVESMGGRTFLYFTPFDAKEIAAQLARAIDEVDFSKDDDHPKLLEVTP